MKRICLATAALLLSAAAVSAECRWDHPTQAMSCPQGSAYDTATGKCVPQVTS